MGNRDFGHLLNARAGSAGDPLPPNIAQSFGRQFQHDFSGVRIHTGEAANRITGEHNASAVTLGRDIVFGAGRFDPASRSGKTLLAHELTHVVQSDQASGPVGSTSSLEAEASGTGSRIVAGLPAGPIANRALAASGPLCDTKKQEEDVINPFSDWKTSSDSLLLIVGDDRLFILPGANTVFFPTDKTQEAFEKSSAHYTQDLGTLFEVPATGASGTRLFQAGRQSALVLDAGYDPTPGQSSRVAAVYLNQVMGIAARLGIRKMSRIQPIHGHSDHITGIPALANAFQVKPENVIIPAEFETLGPVQRIENALRDPSLTARGFGPGWNPQRAPKDKGGPGDLYRGSFMTGELAVEMIGLRSALKTTRANPDLASYLTKVTRRTDNATVVVLGDFRGDHLESIRTEMERQNAGSWNEFFSGVTTVSGFSHHVGRMEAGDIAGMMSLLDATLLRGGRLRVVEQTNTAVNAQARADTLEVAARLGIEIAYTNMPSQATPSAVGATRDSTYTQGPDATAQPVVNSGLTAGLERLRKLSRARLTIEQWRPWLEELNGKTRLEGVTAEFDSSIAQLQQALRQASEAALRVRTAPRAAGATGARDYSASGGTSGQAYSTAIDAIPAQVPAERSMTAEAERNLEELRNKNIEEIPLKVALYRAITQGQYSDQAFTYMMGQLNPMTRDELIGRKPGSNEALTPRHVAFERVRAQFNFERSVLPGETISIQNFSPTGQVGARGVAGVLLFVELWNDVVEPLWSSHKISQQINVTHNLAPFLRRLAFWQQMGVKTSFVGIVDPTVGSPKRITDYADINKKLKDNDLDAIIIEKPGLTDADVLALTVWLTQNVRNYDEYATLFEDSFQDAVTFNANGGTWEQAEWKVRVGYYETSGSNHVEEEWFKHPALNTLMRHYIPWLIANTRALLEQAGKGGKSPAALDDLGYLSSGVSGDAPLRRMRMIKPEDPLPVRVPWTGAQISQWAGQGGLGTDSAEIKFTSPPAFYLVERAGDQSKITGADFTTYTRIRDLETRNREIGTYGSYNAQLNHEYFHRDRNQSGWVWVDTSRIEAVPDPSTAPAPPPAAPTATPHAPPASVSPDLWKGLPGPWRDTSGLGGKLPIRPQLFGPSPSDRDAPQGSRALLPGIGGSF